MDKKVLQLEASSPLELKEALANHDSSQGACLVAIRAFGPNVLTRQFNFPNSSTKDLVAGLSLEASETLSVAVPDLEVAYQITGTDEHGVHGVFSAISRNLLIEYLECFKTHPLIPISLTASAVGAVIDFLRDQALPADNFCLVNFSKPHAVSIIIFVNAKPTFFRELYDLNDNDFKDKINNN